MSANIGKLREMCDRLNAQELICVLCAVQFLVTEQGGSIEPIPKATKAEILAAADLSEKMGACQLPDRPEFFKEVSDFIRANISTLCGGGGDAQ